MADYNININAQDNASATLNRVQGGLGGIAAGAGRVRAALGAAFAVGSVAAIGATVQNTINSFDDLAKSARMAGAATSNEAFQGFQVLKQAMNEAGIDAATFDRAMLQTTSRLREGMEGGEAFADIFNKLGDAVLTANGELASGPELLQAMINGLNEGTISTDEFAKVVGGRAGPLIQSQFASIAGSAEGLAAILEDVEANSNIVSLDAAENAEVFNDTVGRLKEGLGQLLTDAVTPLLPHLVELSQNILANMPQYIEAVKNWFDKLKPAIELVGTVLTDLVVPVMGTLFEALGNIATAIAPLVEAALPYLKEGFDLLSEAVQFVFDKMTPLIEQALPKVKEGFDFLTDAVKFVYDAMQPLIEASLPIIKDLFDAVTSALGFVFDKMQIVYETAIPALQAAFDGIVAIVQSVVDWFNRAAGAIQGIYDKAISLKNGVTGAFSSAAESVTNSTRDMYEGATGWASQMYNEWWGGSIFPDLRDGVISAFQDMAMGAISNTAHMTTQTTAMAQHAGQTFEQVFANTLSSALQTGRLDLGNFAQFFTSKIMGMTQNLGGFGGIIGKIFGGFGGGGGSGLLGGLFSGIGGFFKNIFGGFFANGGFLPSGKIGIVGEAGPEIISGPANITPMSGMGFQPAPVSITINAIDTQTGTQFLLNNSDKIEGIIQRAYNKQGRQGIY